MWEAPQRNKDSKGERGRIKTQGYRLLHLKWGTNKGLLYSAGISAQGYLAAWMGVAFGGQ